MNEQQRRVHDAIAKKLTDEGKLIEVGWQAMHLYVLPKDAPPVQVSEMRKAFFMGAQRANGPHRQEEAQATHEGVRNLLPDVRRTVPGENITMIRTLLSLLFPLRLRVQRWEDRRTPDSQARHDLLRARAAQCQRCPADLHVRVDRSEIPGWLLLTRAGVECETVMED
jgi:hypothetical protein